MLYEDLLKMVSKYFISRGGVVLTTNQDLINYTNQAIQDIYSADSWGIKNTIKIISFSKGALPDNITLNNGIFKIDIGKIETISHIYPLEGTCSNSNGTGLDIKTGVIESDTDDYKLKYCTANYNSLYIPEELIDIGGGSYGFEIRYLKGYKWVSYSEAMSGLELPISDNFIPILINKIYSDSTPLAAFEDDHIIPRYKISERQLYDIRTLDSAVEFTETSPGYRTKDAY